MTDIGYRLKLLREEMRKHKIDIYIIPSVDAHNSEYVPPCWERRAWISGFDGSAGEAIITLDQAYLSTDGRYFLQATNQLDSKHFSLIKQKGFVSEIDQWLLKNAHNKTVGIDPNLLSIKRANHLRELIYEASGNLVFTNDNLVDKCRNEAGDIVKIPQGAAFALPDIYSGESTIKKLQFIRQELVSHNADYLVLNVLDEIAWVFNIRGNDIEYNPLVISYAIIGRHDAVIFVDDFKISEELAKQLAQSGIEILGYDQFSRYLSGLYGSIWFDEKTANYSMLENTAAEAGIILGPSPIVLAKACKNSAEINGARTAHVKDAVAVINFLYWLDNNWQSGVTELSCAEKLAAFREKQPNIKGASFNTISGFAANGAIVHYRVTEDTNKVVDDSDLYLIDSGGQYLEGTTDITRTIHLGTPTAKQKRDYTLVLKGHLALSRAIFLQGTCGEHLDILARSPLWSEYLNYNHGTGHGVGSFLCVHEGPQKISSVTTNTPLMPGMIVSNEPGLYITGEYGIRIENLCLVNKDLSDRAVNSEYGPFYCFENLTLVPYAKNLIDISLLTDAEKNQIRAYYNQIEHAIRNQLGTEEQQWLDRELSIFT